MKTFGIKLRAARIEAGYRTAREFAEHMAIEPPAYRKYERGDASPNLATLTRLCQALAVSPNDLLPEAVASPFRAAMQA